MKRFLFLAGTYDKGVRSAVQQRLKIRLSFPFTNSAAVSGLFSFTVPTSVIFPVRRKLLVYNWLRNYQLFCMGDSIIFMCYMIYIISFARTHI
jgi:hypothetical protein